MHYDIVPDRRERERDRSKDYDGGGVTNRLYRGNRAEVYRPLTQQEFTTQKLMIIPE